MKRRWFQATAFACGVVFALGLGISGMGRPGKVLAFLDVAGDWDPALALVMAAAVGVHAWFAQIAKKRAAPLLDTRFVLPAREPIDRALIAGAALFGIGWGLQGYCPGPAILATPSLDATPLVFVAAMILGQRLVQRKATPRAATASITQPPGTSLSA